MSCGDPGGAGYNPLRCIMSAPFRPAARTLTRTSPDPGSGSGCSSTDSSPSRTVTALTRRMFPRSAEKGSLPLGQGGRNSPRPAVTFPAARVGQRPRHPRMHSPLPYVPPLWRESRIGFELAGLMRSGVWRGDGVADGQGQPVMLVSGLLAGDDSLGIMAKWLKRTGHRPARAGIACNVDCSGKSLERLERRVEVLAERTGQKVAVVGQSRGGSFARVLATRRPDLVSGIVTLGSPLKSGMDVHPVVRGGIYVMGAAGTVGAPGVFGHSCLWGDCCTSFWEELKSDFPPGVGFVSLYSRS